MVRSTNFKELSGPLFSAVISKSIRLSSDIASASSLISFDISGGNLLTILPKRRLSKRLRSTRLAGTLRIRACPPEAHVRRVEYGSQQSKGCNLKKRLGPCNQRELTEEIVKEYDVPVSRACKLTRLPRSQYYYRSVKDDGEVVVELQKLANDPPTYGFRKLFAYLRRAGRPWNHKKVYRVYRSLNMNKRKKGKRRLPQRIKQPLEQQKMINQSWSMDEVKRRTGAKVYAHAADLELITKGEAEHPGTTVTPGIIPAILYLIFIKPGGTKYESLSVDQTIKDGETLSIANDIEIIHTPGHCAGHVALLMRQDGALIAGDTCSNVMGLGYSILNEDRALARQSILHVATYPFEQAVFGHGNPLKKRANQLLKENFMDTKLK
jgi:hypothetical protein